MKTIYNLFFVLFSVTVYAQNNDCILNNTENLEKKLIQYYLGQVDNTDVAALISKPMCRCHNSIPNNKCTGRELRNNLTLLATRSHRNYNTIQKNRIILETLYKIRSIDKDITAYDEELSQLLCTAIVYQEIHEIIHDKMMKLYEWNEFYTFIEMLEIEWNNYKDKVQSILNPDKTIVPRSQLIDAIDNFDTCLSSFKEVLPTSLRNKFEVPCDEMEVALARLLKIYYISNHHEI